jgi:hypothetical protein
MRSSRTTRSPAAWLGARTARKLSIPLVLVEGGGGASEERWRFFKAIGRRLWGRYIRGTAGTVVIALDAVARARLIEQGLHRVSVVPGGVDLSVYRPGLTSGVILRHHIAAGSSCTSDRSARSAGSTRS